jgi:hypothetical protein
MEEGDIALDFLWGITRLNNVSKISNMSTQERKLY